MEYRECQNHDNQNLMYLQVVFSEVQHEGQQSDQMKSNSQQIQNKCRQCLVNDNISLKDYINYEKFIIMLNRKYKNINQINGLLQEIIKVNSIKKKDPKQKKVYEIQQEIIKKIQNELIQPFNDCRLEFENINSQIIIHTKQLLSLYKHKLEIKFDEFFFYDLQQETIQILTMFPLLIKFQSTIKPFNLSKCYDDSIKTVSFKRQGINQTVKSNLQKFQERIFIFGDNLGYLYYYNSRTQVKQSFQYHQAQICVIEKLTENTFCSGSIDSKIITFRISSDDKLIKISEIRLQHQVYRLKRIDNFRIAANQNNNVVILNTNYPQTRTETILKSSNNMTEIVGILHISNHLICLHRNSFLNIWNWKKRFLVRSHTLSKHPYPLEDNWNDFDFEFQNPFPLGMMEFQQENEESQTEEEEEEDDEGEFYQNINVLNSQFRQQLDEEQLLYRDQLEQSQSQQSEQQTQESQQQSQQLLLQQIYTQQQIQPQPQLPQINPLTQILSQQHQQLFQMQSQRISQVSQSSQNLIQSNQQVQQQSEQLIQQIQQQLQLQNQYFLQQQDEQLEQQRQHILQEQEQLQQLHQQFIQEQSQFLQEHQQFLSQEQQFQQQQQLFLQQQQQFLQSRQQLQQHIQQQQQQREVEIVQESSFHSDRSSLFDMDSHIYSRIRLIGKNQIAAVTYTNRIKIVNYNDFYFNKPPLIINIDFEILCLESIPNTDLILIAGKHLCIYNLKEQKIIYKIENEFTDKQMYEDDDEVISGQEMLGIESNREKKFGIEGLIGGSILNQNQIVSIKGYERSLVFIQTISS